MPSASYNKFEPVMMDNPYATVDTRAIEEARKLKEDYERSLKRQKED